MKNSAVVKKKRELIALLQERKSKKRTRSWRICLPKRDLLLGGPRPQHKQRKHVLETGARRAPHTVQKGSQVYIGKGGASLVGRRGLGGSLAGRVGTDGANFGRRVELYKIWGGSRSRMKGIGGITYLPKKKGKRTARPKRETEAPGVKTLSGHLGKSTKQRGMKKRRGGLNASKRNAECQGTVRVGRQEKGSSG